jgi:tetratricopeptide (TPR) repeat protein
MMITLALTAQNSAVTSGKVMFNQANYDEAIVKLEKALENPDALKDKYVTDAWYYLSASYLRKANGDPNNESLKDWLWKSYDAYKQALAANAAFPNDRMQRTIEVHAEGLWAPMYNLGIGLYNDGNDRDADIAYSRALELNPGNSLIMVMSANVKLALGDTVPSIDLYEKGIAAAGEIEDVYVSTYVNAYYILGSLYMYRGNPNRTLEICAQARELFPDFATDLTMLELQTYMNYPNYLEQAIPRFESVLAADPANSNVRASYAIMLENNGRLDEAVAQYKKLHELDPKSIQANYGLGAYWINRSVPLAQQANEEMDMAKFEELEKQINEMMSKALPYMSTLHELQPNEKEWLLQLVTITGRLGMDEEMIEYSNKLRELR